MNWMNWNATEVWDTRLTDFVTWRVVAINDKAVTMSGPGPCRGMQVVPRVEFDMHWRPTHSAEEDLRTDGSVK